jgi:hypothetical protein
MFFLSRGHILAAMTPLCRLRRFLGLTQMDVHIATGVPIRRLSQAESGFVKLNVNDEKLVREYLCHRLRIVRELEVGSQSPRK